MSGNKEGSRKAVATILARDPDFYSRIGAKSWDNPERSHETGFALVPKEVRKELGAKGGRKTKKDYKTKEWPLGREYKVDDKFTIEGEEYKVALVEEVTDIADPTEANKTSTGSR